MIKIDIWNDLGNLYLKADASEAAIAAYNKAIEQGYQSGGIYKNLACAYVNQGNIKASIPLYQKSIELQSDDKEKAIVLTRLGDCYRRMADLDNAIAVFKEAIEIDPGNPALCVGLIEVQRDLEKLWGFAEKETYPLSEGLQSMDELEAVDIPALLKQSLETTVELIKENNDNKPLTSSSVEDEKAEFVEAIFLEEGPEVISGMDAGINPADVGSSFDTSAEVASFADFDENLETAVLVDGADEIPEDLEVPFGSDFVPELAEDEFWDHTSDDGLNLDGMDNRNKEDGVRVTLLLTLGIMHWRNGNLEESDRILQSAIKFSAKIKNSWFEALSWNALALVKTTLGDIVAAIDAYLRAVDLAPAQIFPWNKLGSLYGSLGSHDEAMLAFQKAIKQNPEDSISWDGLGDLYTKLGRLDDAIAAYQLGNVFEKRAQGSDAIKAYEKAFDFYKFSISSFEDEISRPTDDFEQEQEMNAVQDEGTIISAPEAVEDVIAAPEVVDQQTLPEMSLPNSGIDEIDIATEIEPAPIFSETQETIDEQTDPSEMPAGKLELQDVGVGETIPESAQHDVEEMTVGLSEIPSDNINDENFEKVDIIVAPILNEAGIPEPTPNSDAERIAGTIASYEATVKENPKNDRAWDSLGNLYRITQRNSDAILAFERAVSLEPTKYVYHYQLGTLYAAEGKYTDAIREIQKVVELNPTFIFAHCALASYLRRMGQDDEAQQHITIAWPHMANEKEYDRACFESIRGNTDEALELLKIALEKKQTTIEWIRRDLDLDFIRDDSRYELLETRFSQSVVEY